MLLSKCEVCGSKKSKFIKQQGARGLLLRLNSFSRFSFALDVLTS